MSSDKFVGWVAHDKDSVNGNMRWEEYEVKSFKETDIEMDILTCGICYSEISTISSGWGEARYPLVVGHELVGKVTKVGSEVQGIKVGQRMGVGAQCDCCSKCHHCKEGRESYCDSLVGTYNSKFADGSGPSQGGYAKRWRGPARLAIPIPDGLESHIASPLMCGGVTIYSPLEDYGCGGPNAKRVGIIGIGGIGAFGLAFAKALGAEQIVAISTTSSKKELAMEMGATDFLAMKEDPKAADQYRRKLDLIINTANNADSAFDKWVWLLRPRGHLVNIAVPESPVQPIPIGALIFSGANIGGSAIGGSEQIGRMLKLAAEKKPKFFIEKRKMSDANQAIVDMKNGKPRFRYCLVNEGVEE